MHTDEALADLAIMVASLGVPPENLSPFLDRVCSTLDSLPISSSRIVISCHEDLDSECVQQVIDMVNTKNETWDNRVEVFTVGGDYTFAYAYAKGIQRAANIAEVVIEIDSGGGHLPQEIKGFWDTLKKKPDAMAVFSSRFMPGAENRYPLSRRMVSKSATMLSSWLLETKGLTDAASGFELFRRELILEAFSMYPPEGFVSARPSEAFHLIQTELRALCFKMGVPWAQIPITYGAEKEGKPLPLSYVFKSFTGLWEIRKNLENVSRK